MRFTVLSLFPDVIDRFFERSIMEKSVRKGLVEYRSINIRDYAADRHRTCDDAPYGGGAGMVLKPEPLAAALDAVGADGIRTVLPTPSGRLFTQRYARDLAREPELVIVCGRYEGVDQRVVDRYVDDEISIGDYVISSGEVAALVVVDAVYRLVEGVISAQSLSEESFEGGVLEYPHYTRPEDFRGMRIPEVLLSGHHENIRRWRMQKSMEKTLRYRPELLDRVELTNEQRLILEDIRKKGASDERDQNS